MHKKCLIFLLSALISAESTNAGYDSKYLACAHVNPIDNVSTLKRVLDELLSMKMPEIILPQEAAVRKTTDLKDLENCDRFIEAIEKIFSDINRIETFLNSEKQKGALSEDLCQIESRFHKEKKELLQKIEASFNTAMPNMDKILGRYWINLKNLVRQISHLAPGFQAPVKNDLKALMPPVQKFFAKHHSFLAHHKDYLDAKKDILNQKDAFFEKTAQLIGIAEESEAEIIRRTVLEEAHNFLEDLTSTNINDYNSTNFSEACKFEVDVLAIKSNLEAAEKDLKRYENFYRLFYGEKRFSWDDIERLKKRLHVHAHQNALQSITNLSQALNNPEHRKTALSKVKPCSSAISEFFIPRDKADCAELNPFSYEKQIRDLTGNLHIQTELCEQTVKTEGYYAKISEFLAQLRETEISDVIDIFQPMKTIEKLERKYSMVRDALVSFPVIFSAYGMIKNHPAESIVLAKQNFKKELEKVIEIAQETIEVLAQRTQDIGSMFSKMDDGSKASLYSASKEPEIKVVFLESTDIDRFSAPQDNLALLDKQFDQKFQDFKASIACKTIYTCLMNAHIEMQNIELLLSKPIRGRASTLLKKLEPFLNQLEVIKSSLTFCADAWTPDLETKAIEKNVLFDLSNAAPKFVNDSKKVSEQIRKSLEAVNTQVKKISAKIPLFGRKGTEELGQNAFGVNQNPALNNPNVGNPLENQIDNQDPINQGYAFTNNFQNQIQDTLFYKTLQPYLTYSAQHVNEGKIYLLESIFTEAKEIRFELVNAFLEKLGKTNRLLALTGPGPFQPAQEDESNPKAPNYKHSSEWEDFTNRIQGISNILSHDSDEHLEEILATMPDKDEVDKQLQRIRKINNLLTIYSEIKFRQDETKKPSDRLKTFSGFYALLIKAWSDTEKGEKLRRSIIKSKLPELPPLSKDEEQKYFTQFLVDTWEQRREIYARKCEEAGIDLQNLYNGAQSMGIYLKNLQSEKNVTEDNKGVDLMARHLQNLQSEKNATERICINTLIKFYETFKTDPVVNLQTYIRERLISMLDSKFSSVETIRGVGKNSFQEALLTMARGHNKDGFDIYAFEGSSNVACPMGQTHNMTSGIMEFLTLSKIDARVAWPDMKIHMPLCN